MCYFGTHRRALLVGCLVFFYSNSLMEGGQPAKLRL